MWYLGGVRSEGAHPCLDFISSVSSHVCGPMEVCGAQGTPPLGNLTPVRALGLKPYITKPCVAVRAIARPKTLKRNAQYVIRKSYYCRIGIRDSRLVTGIVCPRSLLHANWALTQLQSCSTRMSDDNKGGLIKYY